MGELSGRAVRWRSQQRTQPQRCARELLSRQAAPSPARREAGNPARLARRPIQGCVKGTQMPEIQLRGNGLDGTWILALTHFPRDIARRNAFYAIQYLIAAIDGTPDTELV